ncbi:MAG: sigma-70 region 4 domain-containing protein [Thermoanaerobaculia bacterium]
MEDGEPSFDPPAPPVADRPSASTSSAAIATLSPRLRAVFLLFDLHGHNHEEIAGLLGITAGASKVQLHRARTRLKEVLG